MGGPEGGFSERTAADLSSLLVELGRLLKGASFYGPTDANTKDLALHAFRAWKADLERSGPLELHRSAGRFRAEGVPEAIGPAHLGELPTALAEAGIEHLRFSEDLSAESLLQFASTLSGGRAGAKARPEPQAGIEIDGCSVTSEARTVGTSGASHEPAPATLSQSIAVSEPRSGRAPIPVSVSVPEPTARPTWSPPEARASLGASLLGGRAELLASEEHKPTIEENPLQALAETEAGARLLYSLRELDRCTNDETYTRLATQVARRARSLSDEGDASEAHRAVLVLALHAAGEAGKPPRSPAQVEVARATLLALAKGERLDELIARACSRESQTSIRSAQVLLLLGENAVVPLLDRLDASPDGAHAGQLKGLLIALGDSATRPLASAILSGPNSRRRLAIRIAGELQCPFLATALQNVLCTEAEELRRDAAKALVEMGNNAAIDALLVALESDRERVGEVAAFCLGALGAPRTLAPLTARLKSATQQRAWRLVLEILRSIGQFGGSDTRTARELLMWISRGGRPWRRPSTELKLEAINTLGQLSGRAATQSLRSIASGGAPRLRLRLRRHAQHLLDRR